ncbi:hypothetical protein GWK47_017182 [Chionoecetes opilio]|uniref:Uncharacterized protein n=1 Tax=Chionoecetes opilio TaxID=41210 RepID=A0A8J4XR33_CHIOP|nr:hypothetical protein GWK47_017182 [Chionoecetes opilio]
MLTERDKWVFEEHRLLQKPPRHSTHMTPGKPTSGGHGGGSAAEQAFNPPRSTSDARPNSPTLCIGDTRVLYIGAGTPSTAPTTQQALYLPTCRHKHHPLQPAVFFTCQLPGPNWHYGGGQQSPAVSRPSSTHDTCPSRLAESVRKGFWAPALRRTGNVSHTLQD